MANDETRRPGAVRTTTQATKGSILTPAAPPSPDSVDGAPPPPATRTGVAPPNVGARIRRLRQAHKMSLDELAARAGVSKSVLSQMERNLNNPTLTTLWGICGAFGLSLEELLRSEAAVGAVEHLPAHETPVIRGRDPSCRLRILGPVSCIGWLQWYELTLAPGAKLDSAGHDPGAREHLTLLEGAMTVRVAGAQRTAATGETLRYPADKRHVVENPGPLPARALMVVLLRPAGG